MSRRHLQKRCTQAHFTRHGAQARHGLPHRCRTCQARPSWLMDASLLSLCRHITGKLMEHRAPHAPCELVKVTTHAPSKLAAPIAISPSAHLPSFSTVAVGHTHNAHCDFTATKAFTCRGLHLQDQHHDVHPPNATRVPSRRPHRLCTSVSRVLALLLLLGVVLVLLLAKLHGAKAGSFYC